MNGLPRHDQPDDQTTTTITELPFNFRPFLAAILLLCLLGFLLAFSGCATNPKCITSVTESVIGIDISQSPKNQSPHVRIGFVRSQYHVIPTAKDIDVPKFSSSIEVQQKGLSTTISEQIGTAGAAKSALIEPK